jgi:hypothetical protein
MSGLLVGAVRILLMAQAAQATVGGVVRNGDTGEPIAGAVVTFTDLDRSVVSGPDGRYEVFRVPTGPQHITVRYIGHSQHTLHALVPPRGRLNIDVWLRPVPVRLAAITVRSPVEIRGVIPEEGVDYPDRSLTMASVRNHPLLAEPDALLALGGGEVSSRPEAPNGLHVRGGASDQTGYLLDGIPVLNPYHAGGVFGAWNPDAVARLRLSASPRTPSHPPSLSGVVEAETSSPGQRLRAQGSASTTQARVTLDGPIGSSGAGYLLSLRTGFPDVLAPRAEASYLRGATQDLLAKVESPLPHGRLSALLYQSGNDLNTAVVSASDTSSVVAEGRNDFEWHSRSLGATWSGNAASLVARATLWSVASDADASWAADGRTLRLSALRQDAGLLLQVERQTGQRKARFGLRYERIRTQYAVQADSGDTTLLAVDAKTPVASLFAEGALGAGDHLTLTLGTYLATTGARLHPGPSAVLEWRPSGRLLLSARVSRHHQFAQSLRNAESVVGTVFPADLHIGTGARGVPTGRGDLVLMSAELRPVAGIRVGAQAYARWMAGLVLAAPVSAHPFAAEAGFVAGSARAGGLSVEASAGSSRLGAVASYGLTRVSFAFGDSSYVPEHGTRHSLEAGAVMFPTATLSFRIGATALMGRRTTAFAGEFEWEACNLLDQGCEFSGSPRYGVEPLGGKKLPAYVRLDAGVRKHWHLEVAGRDVSVALFGTVTNLLGSRNVLTYAKDPATGRFAAVEMRPRAPLVVGLDWRF